jgi:hypothetical protein
MAMVIAMAIGLVDMAALFNPKVLCTKILFIQKLIFT